MNEKNTAAAIEEKDFKPSHRLSLIDGSCSWRWGSLIWLMQTIFVRCNFLDIVLWFSSHGFTRLAKCIRTGFLRCKFCTCIKRCTIKIIWDEMGESVGSNETCHMSCRLLCRWFLCLLRVLGFAFLLGCKNLHHSWLLFENFRQGKLLSRFSCFQWRRTSSLRQQISGESLWVCSVMQCNEGAL